MRDNGMNFSAKQELSQKQTLSHEQMLSLQMLAMGRDELDEFLRKEQEENPLLEPPEPADRPVFEGGHTAHAYTDIPAPQTETIAGYLLEQIDRADFSGTRERALHAVLDALDDNGYLTLPAQELAALEKLPPETVQACIRTVQALDPPGIGAESLAQCLALQLARMDAMDDTMHRLLYEYLEYLGAGQYQTVCRGLGISRRKLGQYLAKLQQLDPHPGASLQEARTEYIIPDIVCTFQEGQWKITISKGWMEGMAINTAYAKLINENTDSRVAEYIEGRLRRARLLRRCIEKRHETITLIAKQLVLTQEDYLLGKGALKPLTFRAAAAQTGLHESTIGRAIQNKYMQCPRGTYPVRSFFSSALGGSEEQSRDYVLRLLKARLKEEDKRRPYSDQALADWMSAQGTAVSRRTIAKYRDILGIPSTIQRKKYED